MFDKPLPAAQNQNVIDKLPERLRGVTERRIRQATTPNRRRADGELDDISHKACAPCSARGVIFQCLEDLQGSNYAANEAGVEHL